MQEDRWDASVLQAAQRELSESTLRRYQDMGEISPEEIIDFHYALEKLGVDPEEEAQRS